MDNVKELFSRFIERKKAMPFNETNRLSDTHSDHIDKRTAPNRLDYLRLISSQRSKETLSISSNAQDKGKNPASYQENDPYRGRAVGEDGKPIPRTVELASVSTPEHPILAGGMRRGNDQASMRRSIRAEDLAQMPANERVD